MPGKDSWRRLAIRDAGGRWVHGFVANLETCSSLQAEMWGASYGLDLALNLGFLKLEIKADSTDLVASLHIGGAVLVDPISS